MVYSTIFEELQRVQWLVIALFAVIAIWYFRLELKGVMNRLSKLEARRKDTAFTATLESPASDTSLEDETDSPPTGEADGTANEDVSPTQTEPPESTLNAIEVRDAMIGAYIAGEKVKGDELFNRLGSLETDPTERRRDQVRQLATEVVGGINADGLDSLEERVVTDDDPSFVYRMIGLCLEATEKPAEAAAMDLKAIETAKTLSDRIRATVARSKSLVRLGLGESAISELWSLLDSKPDRTSKIDLYEALGTAYSSSGQQELSGLALYKAASLAGNSARKWFRAGYGLSRASSEPLRVLVVHCYLNALVFDDDHPAANNNLAVSLRRIGLPIEANEYYKRASALGNTLATANLAEHHLDAGFADEARVLLKSATEAPDPADKVSRVTAEITKQTRVEREKFNSLKEAGSRVGHIMSCYFEARQKASPALGEEWYIEGHLASATFNEDEFVLSWDTESALGGRRFAATLVGRALTGRFEKEGFSFGPTERPWENDGWAYGFVEDSNNGIQLMRISADETEYMTIARSSDVASD